MTPDPRGPVLALLSSSLFLEHHAAAPPHPRVVWIIYLPVQGTADKQTIRPPRWDPHRRRTGLWFIRARAMLLPERSSLKSLGLLTKKLFITL